MSNKKQNGPMFSIILAFRNESKFLKDCLDSFDNQSLPRDQWEMILVDGQSHDGSELIAREYCERHENCKLLNNPKKLAVSGWNIGVNVSSGKYYFPASGHSIIDHDFLLEAKIFFEKMPDVHALGGRVNSIGNNKVSRAIGIASNTAFAMGGVYYRIGDRPKRVNVVGLGIYSKELYLAIGPYKEDFARSGDWEFNYRAWSADHKMYINPAMKSKLNVRANYWGIFKQQYRTGYWKIKVWAMHPRSLLPRHIIPAVFVLWIISMPFFLISGNLFLLIGVFPMILYVGASAYSVINSKLNGNNWLLVLFTYPVIHISYGLGFLAGLFKWGGQFFKLKKSRIEQL